MADTPEEHLTEELLDRLLHSAKIETYLDEEHITDRALPDYLNELLDRSGIKRNPLAEKTGMNQTFIYDIFAGKSGREGTTPSDSRSGSGATCARPSGCCGLPA